MTLTDIPMRNAVSMLYVMRQELSGVYSMAELESLIQRTFKELLNMDRMALMLRPETPIDEEAIDRFAEVIERLKKEEPIQYIFGHTEFYGLHLNVEPGVLIPRPETEELVHWMLAEEQRRAGKPIRVLDIGTGSGCIAMALAKKWGQAEVWATDVSDVALELGRKNAAKNNVKVQFVKASILNGEPEQAGMFDIIVSNPPYVTRDQMPAMRRNVLDFEPHLALFAEGKDPLLFYRAIARYCQKHLKPDGTLYLEINEDLPSDTTDLLRSFNFTETSVRKDLNGRYRMVKAGW